MRRLWGKGVHYLREVSGQAEFQRLCHAHEATHPDGGSLSAKTRRALWRAHSERRAHETNRCC
ncbi:CstA-like transporter-associated (seleno)protein [Streptomyces sp. NPDC050636]|uniref:CstA-like transporter-associated (seleno)protein n=1 Tax=Streptomyces sp. NPDC050636 TaxID=3154510 RepID=UPI00343DA847